MEKDPEFIAKGTVIIKISGVTRGRKKPEETELNVSFKFCFETEFKKDIVPFGINYFGSCTWLIISMAFKISVKQTYFAHIHPPFEICLLSSFPELFQAEIYD